MPASLKPFALNRFLSRAVDREASLKILALGREAQVHRDVTATYKSSTVGKRFEERGWYG